MSGLLQTSRNRTKRIAVGCGAVVIVTAVIAFLPAATPRIEVSSLEMASQVRDDVKLAPLDVKAFDTPVWTIAAAPQPPAPAPPPPPPLKLQLIGILKEDQGYKAVLYDPDTNKLFVVASGQEAQGHKIDKVAPNGVTVKDGTLVRTLALKTGGGVGDRHE